MGLIDAEQIRSLYESGKSTNEIAKAVGASQAAVWKRLKALGVELRPRGSNKGPRKKRERIIKKPKVRLDFNDELQVYLELVKHGMVSEVFECPCGSGQKPNGSFGPVYPLDIVWSCDACKARNEAERATGTREDAMERVDG